MPKFIKKIRDKIRKYFEDRKHKKLKEKRLKELKKRDPFIYH